MHALAGLLTALDKKCLSNDNILDVVPISDICVLINQPPLNNQALIILVVPSLSWPACSIVGNVLDGNREERA